MEDNLKPEYRIFCEELVIDWNQTRAYMVAYPKSTSDSARRNASRLMTNDDIQAYIKKFQKNLSKATGITAIRNALELAKVAYSNISDLKKNWHDFKDWEDLSEEEKAAISEITHSEITIAEDITKEVVKVKMHDKLKALQMLNKMFGFDEADKHDLTTGGEKIKSINPITWANGKD